MDARKRLKEIEEGLYGDEDDVNLDSAKKYLESLDSTKNKNGVKSLLKVFEKLKKDAKLIHSKSNFTFSFYQMAKEKLKLFDYTLDDIEYVCPIIDGNEDEIGIFISAAINKIIKDEDEVRLNFGGRRVRFVGMYLEKGKIVIEGDIGDFVGAYMVGGEIIVKGNVEECAGSSMRGGKITIEGSAGDYVGFYSEGGEIWIYGDYKRIDEHCKAKVYHKGELIKNG